MGVLSPLRSAGRVSINLCLPRPITALVEADPDLAGHPALAAAIDSLLDEEQAEFLEKT